MRGSGVVGAALTGLTVAGAAAGFRVELCRTRHRVPVSPAARDPRRTPACGIVPSHRRAMASSRQAERRPAIIRALSSDSPPPPDNHPPRGAPVPQEALHPHVRLPDERVRLGQDGRRARRRRRPRRSPTARGRRRHPVQHVLGAREGAGAGVPRPRAACARSRPRNPDLIIGVGGCVASQEGAAIVGRAPVRRRRVRPADAAPAAAS